MPQRLEMALRPELPDPAGRSLMHKAGAYLGLRLAAVRVVRVLTFDTGLAQAELARARAEIFTNPVTELSSFAPLAPQILPEFDYALWLGFKPGVRDNEGATALEAMANLLGRGFGPGEAVYAARLFLVSAPRLKPEAAEALCRELLANDLVHNWRVIPRAAWDPVEGVGLVAPRVRLAHEPAVATFRVDSDLMLRELSAQRDLFLNPADVPVIRRYFADPAVRAARAKVGLADPTDVELEYVSQARSDHCNHNTFRGRFYYVDAGDGSTTVVDDLFRQCIKKPTEDLARERDWVVSVLWDNAGVARLDGETNYVITGETHNSPSNMEAYGGSLTGIVGVYRDPMGTGLGAKLCAGMWGFCVGPRDYAGPLRPRLHPRRLLDGLIEGVKDGGNKSGIPTVFGNLFFDPRYLGKCLVFVAAVGVMPGQTAGRPSHEKTTTAGEIIFMCGGRVGADGIHGVTASSAGYSADTPAGHVQIGDPYTQKKMHDFLLEARDAGLIAFLTDNGGGGLSSSIGESARFSRGAVVDLAKVPLKYQGLDPWQIWVSESQERMTVSVKPEHEAAFRRLAAKHAVEATAIGEFRDDGKLQLNYGTRVCAYVDVDFTEEGFPQWEFQALWRPPEARGLVEPVLAGGQDLNGLVLDLLDHPNLCSRAWINRQFDHEVQGTSLLKPFGGVDRDLPSEAGVIQPELTRPVGLALAQVLSTDYGDIDTYHMVTASVEEGFRRVVAVGGDPSQVGGVDNFCWPSVEHHPVNNPDGDYKAAQLVRACWGLRDACLALGIPLLSGKDSMYVDGMIPDRRGVARRISGPPTMMFTATAPVPRLANVQSLEPKIAGDLVWVLGATKNELGAGALYQLMGAIGRNVPQTDLAASLALGRAVSRALEDGLLASVAVVSRGGLALCFARLVLAGGLGLDLDLAGLAGEPGLSPLCKLFSESTGRLVVTLDPARAPEARELFQGLAVSELGRVTRRARLTVAEGGATRLDLARARLATAWRRRFGGLV
ncbi:MAG: phosphoribosylformylglycinamidine synthase [Deltaproteobacteria bacterium]|nr:phosphoribosylformylglycinamidine synthase [Deltaproteobacteria bacterium]